MKILAIDDNQAVLEVITLMLATGGHTVLAAASGREALARLAGGESVDLILTDLAMPEMDGWEVVKAVRSRCPSVPIGLITGAPLYLREEREPVDLIITKPVTIESIRQAIAGLGEMSTTASPARRPTPEMDDSASSLPTPQWVATSEGEPFRFSRWIVLVARGDDALYEYLRDVFRADTNVEVVMDRRRDLRRSPAWIAELLRAHEGALICREF